MNHVELEVAGRVGIVTLNRPRVLNAFTPQMLDELLAALGSLEQESRVVGVVLRGSGGAFCAGADIRWQREATAEQFRSFIATIQHLTRRLRTSDRLVVAAIEGPAVGGGSELALGCDFRIAAPNALLGFPEGRLGLTVTGGVTHLLPRLVGTSRALELLMSGRTLSAAEALQIGLVDRVESDAVAAAVEFASAPSVAPGLVGLIKAGLYAGAEGTVDSALRMEQEVIAQAVLRPAAREGMSAFLEKREPRFD